VISLGTNDADNETLANNYQANLTSLVGKLRASFGDFSVALIQTGSAVNRPYKATVRSQALSWIAADGNAALVYTDDMVLSDGLHYTTDELAILGQRAAYVVTDLVGYGREMPAGDYPIYVGAGIATGSQLSMAPRSWPGTVSGDREFLVVTTGGLDIAPSLSSAQGFTAIAGASAESVFAGAHQKIAVWTRDVTQETLDANNGIMPTPTVADTNDLLAAKIYTVRGPSGAPAVNASGGSANDAYSPSLSMTGVTTTADDCLILHFVTGYTISNNNPASGSNGSLTSVTNEPSATVSVSDSYRVLSLVTGIKASAGATGTTAITMVADGVLVGAMIAVEP
jgi:hypothetical protein